jgi:hypothetical protein
MLRKETEKEMDKIIEECGAFFAFNEEQLKAGIEKNKEKILKSKEGKYLITTLENGLIIPLQYSEKFVEQFIKTGEEGTKRIQKEIPERVLLREALINHEATYTMSIEDSLESLSIFEIENLREKLIKELNSLLLEEEENNE